MNKKIYFYPFPIENDSYILKSYWETGVALKEEKDEIHTYCMSYLDFDLLDDGYDIYIFSKKENKLIKLKTPMYLEYDKCITRVHNIYKIFRARSLDYLLGDTRD